MSGTAIVIGGAQGTGRACSEALTAHGIKVCVGDVEEDIGKALETSMNQGGSESLVVFRHCDVRDESDIEALFVMCKDKLGEAPRAVFNMAGIQNEKDWQALMDVNIGGNIRCINAMIRHTSRESGGNGGVFVPMSSMCGLRPLHFAPVYSASKHTVVGLCRSWGTPEHYAIHGIRFNCVCPTAIDTGFLAQVSTSYFPEEHVKRLEQINKLTPQEVAAGFIRALDDKSLNGQAIRVTEELGVDLAIFQETPNH